MKHKNTDSKNFFFSDKSHFLMLGILVLFIIIIIILNLIIESTHVYALIITGLSGLLIFVEIFAVIKRIKKNRYDTDLKDAINRELSSHYFRIDVNYKLIETDYALYNGYDDFFVIIDEIFGIEKNMIIPLIKQANSTKNKCREILKVLMGIEGFKWYKTTIMPLYFKNKSLEYIILINDITDEYRYKINVELLEKTQKDNMILINRLERNIAGYDFIQFFFDKTYKTLTNHMNEVKTKLDLILSIDGKIKQSDDELLALIKDLKNTQNKEKEILVMFKDSFNHIMNSYTQLQNQILSISGIIHGLEKSFLQLKESLAIITDISEKTKLLSINTNIEAAHAGDAGQGFRIIGSQIRQLSESTQTKVTEIEHTIKDFSQSLTTISEIDNEITVRIKETFERFNNFTRELDEGNDVIDKANDKINSIITILKSLITNYSDFSVSIKDTNTIIMDYNNTFIKEIQEITNQIKSLESNKNDDDDNKPVIYF